MDCPRCKGPMSEWLLHQRFWYSCDLCHRQIKPATPPDRDKENGVKAPNQFNEKMKALEKASDARVADRLRQFKEERRARKQTNAPG